MDLSKLSANQGGSIVSFFSTTKQVPIGSDGDLIIITPPDGKRVSINALSCTTAESGITVSGSVQGNVVQSKTLNSNTQDEDVFLIGPAASNTGGAITKPGIIRQLTFAIDEVVTIEKDSGVTASVIYYSYTYGS